MAALRFSLLGPLTVTCDGTQLSVPVGKIRVLLAALLLRPNQVVPLDQLTERMWGQRPPRNPRRVVQTNIVRLRQILDLSEVIQTEPGGYLACLEPGQLDLLEFQQLMRLAADAATPVLENRFLHEALALWRGPACADVDSDALHQIDVPPLTEQRLYGLERRIDLDIQLGEDAALIAELRGLTAEHPLRERLWVQLMTTLCRTGRQAEALEAYRTVTHLLKEELGIDPGAELRRLHQAVLTQEHAHQTRPPSPAPSKARNGRQPLLRKEDPAAGALPRTWRERESLTQEHLAARACLNVHAAPRQLPTDVGSFVGREPELAVLVRAGDTTTAPIIAIDGMAGAGKTALAVHAAHELAPRFPDGNLFIDLHGYTCGVAPADPADTLARVLGVLGVPGESIPRHLDDRAALYRSVLADKKLLIVLDNAADEAQVRPLLPGEGSCLVLITGRRRLVGLDGARTVTVDVMPLTDAVALFAATAARQRLVDTPAEALTEVVRWCGLLPLAIRLAAARLNAHPAWSVSHLLERLRRRQHRLSELHAGQRSVTAALDVSYRTLTTAERRAYRLLGLHAGVDITPDAAAALLATTVTRASVLLDRLLESHLLQEQVPARYRFHDLISAHAAEKAVAEEPEAEQRAALSRLLDYYSRGASAAIDRLYPYEFGTRPCLDPSGILTPPMADAAGWLKAELPNLLALARHGFPDRFHSLGPGLAAQLPIRRVVRLLARHRGALQGDLATACTSDNGAPVGL
ncbi:AfsR/SARP family transcriptional regulator [Nonomuraea sp. KM90]|uniref:AfsR/SARP family transcriptional regulator n=1 Tax=Nonomuraea sp. KM90 TaxID=3457428 RepID=UPI003FCE751E